MEPANSSVLKPFAKHFKCLDAPLELFNFGTKADAVTLPAGNGQIEWAMDAKDGAVKWHERARFADAIAGEIKTGDKHVIATDDIGLYAQLLHLILFFPDEGLAAVYLPMRGAWTEKTAEDRLFRPGVDTYSWGSPSLLRRLSPMDLPRLRAINAKRVAIFESPNQEDRLAALLRLFVAAAPAASSDLPVVYLPKEEKHGVNGPAAELSALMKDSGKYYKKGGFPVVIDGETADGRPALKVMSPAAASGHFERVARLCRHDRYGRDQLAVCRKDDAELLLSSPSFSLPEINTILPCPILSEDESGQLRLIQGYDPATRCYATGPELPAAVPLEEAKATIEGLLRDFNFLTPGDRSRALGTLISPALIFSGLLGKARAPIEMAEADGSQAGKGFRLRLTAAIYGMDFTTVTQKDKGGVGSVKESFDQSVYEGHPAIQFDNWRGSLDFPWLEAFATENSYSARPFGKSAVTLDPRRHWLAITTNKAEPTIDLANRMNIVRITKQPDDHPYQTFGDDGKMKIDEWVAANQPYYLACVYSIVEAWHAAGKPRTGITRGDSFTRWAQIIDWIAINLFGWASVMDGHAAAKARLVNPSLQWLRAILLSARKHRVEPGQLTASKILELAQEDDIGVKGVNMERIDETDDRRKAALIAVGRELGKIFKDGPEQKMDGINLVHTKDWDEDKRRDKNVYTISYDQPLAPLPAAKVAEAASPAPASRSAAEPSPLAPTAKPADPAKPRREKTAPPDSAVDCFGFTPITDY